MDNDSLSMLYKKMVVAFDGSPGSQKALHRALLLSKDHGCEITALSVDEHTPRYAPGVGKIEEEPVVRKAVFREFHDQALSLASKLGVEIKIETVVGHAAQSIVSYVGERGCDVIVIGHSGHSGVWGTLLGSTTARVVDHACCDVLVVR